MDSFAIDYTVSKLVSLIGEEVSLLGGIEHELTEIKNELLSMRAFLDDSARKGTDHSEGEKAWVDNVRDLVYDVEDIIDEITYHVNRPKSEFVFIQFLQKTIQTPKYMWVRHCTAKKLGKINGRIKAISERRLRYGVNQIEGTSLSKEQKRLKNHGESSLFINENELVGIEDEKETLLHWLTDEGPRLKAISVVGMGGSGKTCLVAQVFNSPIVKRHFDCYAWISVSQNYVAEDLLRRMILEFCQVIKELMTVDLSSMNFRQLMELLTSFLKRTRYVIVLDDVWNINLWQEIRFSLPDNGCGSRVLLTTRKKDISFSSFGVKSQVYVIQPLRQEDSWNLFCLKAFPYNPKNMCPLELQIFARDMVEKCKGLPMAIVALGGLMASKKLEAEWRKVCNSLNWELSNNPMLEVVKNVLLLSFHDLPNQLKQCFLYCSIFPEDCLIRRKRLIRLWMAEGFVEEIEGLTLEEVAESYLTELGHRSMLEVLYTQSGKAKACKMHDLMRELAISISERERFCHVSKGQLFQEVIGERRARRLSIRVCDKKLSSWTSMYQLRSLFVFMTDYLTSTSSWSIPSGFRLLRVLDLEFIPLRRLPEDIGNLFNLRYLNLKGTQIDELPKSLEKICNLQTLNLYQTKVTALPHGLVKLQKLRYLIASYYNLESVDDFNYASGARVSPGVLGKLKNLQVLHFVEANGTMSMHLKKLTQLTCLGVSNIKAMDESPLCSSIENMHLLCHLTIKASKVDEILHMDALSSPPARLRRLSLIGMLEKIPHWFHLLQNLTALYLSWSRLREDEDPITRIQNMPKLKSLTLTNAYLGKKLCFLSGFPALTNLIFRNFPQLEEVVIENGVMPSLQNLWHSKCMSLKMVPRGIEYLRNLEQVYLLNVSSELIDRIHNEDGADRLRIRHIPKISHYYQTPAGWSYESLS